MALLLRRGLEEDRLTFTPEEGELIYVTDTKLIYVGDGVTPGGILISGGGGAPIQPTYILSSSVNSVNEGETFTITLTTTNVTDGTLVPYTITGVTPDDINGQSLTGNFVISSNTSSLVVVITNDENFEAEQFTLTLVGIIPTNSISVNILDISLSGGSTSTIFDSIINGGNPTTTIFDSIINGGQV